MTFVYIIVTVCVLALLGWDIWSNKQRYLYVDFCIEGSVMANFSYTQSQRVVVMNLFGDYAKYVLRDAVGASRLVGNIKEDDGEITFKYTGKVFFTRKFSVLREMKALIPRGPWRGLVIYDFN